MYDFKVDTEVLILTR